MPVELSVYFIVCPFVFFAGLIDSVAGGGGLISLPAYLMAGLPPQFAVATNKLSAFGGAAVASVRYYKNKYTDAALCVPSIITALAGSALGSAAALLADERLLRLTLIIVLPVTAIYVFKKTGTGNDEGRVQFSRVKTMIVSAVISFFIGGYDGFSGPGTGTFLFLAYNAVARMNIRTALGNAKLVNFSSNLSALVLFLFNGRVIIPLGLCAAAFNMAGAYIGSGLAIHKGTKIIRRCLFVVLILLFAKMIWDTIPLQFKTF